MLRSAARRFPAFHRARAMQQPLLRVALQREGGAVGGVVASCGLRGLGEVPAAVGVADYVAIRVRTEEGEWQAVDNDPQFRS